MPKPDFVNGLLNNELEAITKAHADLVQYAIKGSVPNCEHLVIHIDIECECQSSHCATFYTHIQTNREIQSSSEDYLLADVSGSDLRERLDGLFSKSEVMDFLEKLIIRWHLTSDQIIVACPFVGHRWLSREDKMRVWTWLLSNLDPHKSVFITRKAALDKYKQVLCDVDGLNFTQLKEYGLENKLISADTRRQDFHAKFFIGRSENECEVLSGSANLVTGPSIENISFSSLKPNECDAKYIEKIKVKLPLMTAQKGRFGLVTKMECGWRSTIGEGCRLAK